MRILLHKAGSRNWAVSTKFLLDLAGPANLFLIAVGLSFGLLWIQMSDNLKIFAFRALLLMFYIAFFWYVYNLISIVDATFQRIGRKTDSSLAMHVCAACPPHVAGILGCNRRHVYRAIGVKGRYWGLVGGVGDRRVGGFAGRPGFVEKSFRFDHDYHGPVV